MSLSPEPTSFRDSSTKSLQANCRNDPPSLRKVISCSPNLQPKAMENADVQISYGNMKLPVSGGQSEKFRQTDPSFDLRKTVEAGGDKEKVNALDKHHEEYQAGGSPHNYSISQTFSVTRRPARFTAMDSSQFCGPVIKEDSPSKYHYSKFSILDTDGDIGTTEVPDMMRNQVATLAKSTQISETAAAVALASSCGKLYVWWVDENTGEELTKQQSGFWVEERFFLASVHFVKGDLTGAATLPYLQELVDPTQRHECWVSTRQHSERVDQEKDVQVWLKTWNPEASMALFEASKVDPRRKTVALDSIGFIEREELKQRNRMVFTAGYCGKQERPTSEQLNDPNFRKHWAEFKAAKATGLPKATVFTVFDFFLWHYEQNLQSSSDAQHQARLAYAKTSPPVFREIFVPNVRAIACGEIGLADPLNLPNIPDSNQTEDFRVNANISLYHGLSGSPIVAFQASQLKWQVVGVVHGGDRKSLYNQVSVFKHGFVTMVKDLLQRAGHPGNTTSIKEEMDRIE